MRAVGYRHQASPNHPQQFLDPQQLPDPQYQLNPQYLVDIKLTDPSPGADDLLVRVEAVAVNPVDVKVRRRGTGGCWAGMPWAGWRPWASGRAALPWAIGFGMPGH